VPLTENTVVWASAGTGKTRKLVDTWVQLVEEGADPLRVVAITFTEKAAAEMRVRVRQAILDGLINRDPEAHSHWTRVLGLLPAAPISTIHGFCGLLLREHGLHAGIDPGFSIVDEQRSLDLAREAAVDTLRDEIRSGNEKAARLFGDFGLQELVNILVSTGYWLNSLGRDSAWLVERALAQTEAARELRASVAEHLERHGGDFERIGLFADEQEAKRAKHPLRQRKEPHAPLPRIGQIAGAAVAMDLSELVRIFIERFRASRRSSSSMDFDDLLLETRNLLRDSPEVRRRCQEHYQALLVDEFQDTDEVQAEIVRLLCLDRENETRLAQGKLMIVGDPKQSIYRFRRARVTVFVSTMRKIKDEGGKLQHLQENYRSAPPLVEFSNRLSLRMMDGLGAKEVPEETDTSYRIRFSEADILIPRSEREFLGVTYIAADPDTKAPTGRRMEAKAIARLLNSYRSAGTISSWRETAILTRTMTHIDIYIDELEAHGIPVHVIDGPSFYKKTEVSDLIALLEFVLHPEDPVARAIVYSSSLAGVTFRKLLEVPPHERPEEKIDAIVRPWIEKRDRATAAEILEDVVRRTHFDVIMAAQKNGRQRAANIGKLIEITRTLARQGTTALDDVVRQLRARANDPSVREPEAQTTGEDEDVVQLMTVHRAKGLEFDVVIVPDLMARTSGAQSNSTMLSDRWGILAAQAYGLHRNTLPHSLILEGKAEDADQQFEEEKRLLYVAVTRARKMLVLGAGYAGKAPGGWRRWVEDLLEEAQPGALDRAREGKPSRARIRSRGQNFSVEIVSAATLARPEQLALNIGIDGVRRDAAHREFLEIDAMLSSPRRSWTGALELTPSDLAALAGCFRRFHLTRVVGEVEPKQSADGASGSMRLGSLAHEILEAGDQLSLQDLERLGVPELRAVFESREWRELDNPEREVPFLLHIKALERDCFVRGRMDAVVLGYSPRVIDYKYASPAPGAESAYEMQMAVYTLALMKSQSIDRVLGELWYLKPSLKVSRREYRRDETERRVTALVERYLEAMTSAEWLKAERSFCDSIRCGFRGKCWES
jgi:ATP-dependent helicase/nuclease subunit A